MEDYKKYITKSLTKIIGVSVIVLPILSLFFLKSNDKSISYFLGFFFVTYMIIINKEVFLSSKDILIYYTLIPWIKFRYPLKDISKVKPFFYGGLGSDEALKISLKSGKRKTFYLSMGKGFQIFVNDLRQNNIEVDTSRHRDLK